MFKLAIRNVLRNSRRSALTLASVVVGVSALFFIQSLIKSLQAEMADRHTNLYSSHLQVQAASSQDPKIPEFSFGSLADIENTLSRDRGIEAFSKRALFTALVASAQDSSGVGVIAVEPQKETLLSRLPHYLKEGRFLQGSGQVLLGRKVAKKLDVRVGEKVVVMAQGRDGSFGGKGLRVAGIFETGSYTWDASVIYMELEDAQKLLAWGDEINTLAIKLHDVTKMEAVRSRLEGALDVGNKGLKILTWKDVGPEIVNIQRFQNSILYLIMTVVFVIVALGILNTMLMSLFERIREFGLMMALGAKRKEVAFLLLIESAYLGATGMAWGAFWGASLIVFFHFWGLPLPIGKALSHFLPFDNVLYLRFAWPSHFLAVFSVIVVSILAGLIPALRIFRLRAAEALRHV